MAGGGEPGRAGPAGARAARRPIAAGPPSPGGWGSRRRRCRRNVPRLRRRASARHRGGCAQSGGGGRARTDVPGALQPPSRPAARSLPAARAAPPARHGVMDHLQAGSVSGLLPRVPSFPSFSAPAPGLRPPPCAAAINTRRPLILVGTVAAEVAGKRAAQDAAIALRGPAGDRGTGGRGRQGWGARPPRVARLRRTLPLCSPGWWDLRRPRMGAPQ